MMPTTPAYGLWALAFMNSAVVLVFALSFARPTTRRDWRAFGVFTGFVVALFAEMYGFPLTVYLLSGWLGSRYPAVHPFSHESGHLWQVLFGGHGNPHLSPLHLAGTLLVVGGFVVLAWAWPVLYAAQRAGRVATTGPYARIRHPQYAGFVLIMLGFLLQWPTLPTLLMFPVLVVMYVRLAHREEREALARFGDIYRAYARTVPAFWPRLIDVGAALPPAPHEGVSP